MAVPVHVLVGERSPAELHRVADALASAVPDATLTTVPEQDHLVAAEVLLPLLVDRLLEDSVA